MAEQKTSKAWMAALEPPLRAIADTLVRIIKRAEPEISDSIKWGNPVYEKQGLVCYLTATKAYVSLGFFRGAELADPEGSLDGKGKKLRHIKLGELCDVRTELISAWVKEAAKLNQQR